jgi:predicted AlkP superfamily pyrophosphatase or phosphodiesterase
MNYFSSISFSFSQRKITVLLFQFCFVIFGFAQTIPNQPKLVVTIVVEQMRYDYLTRFSPHFSKGGFKKIMQQGTQCINTQVDFAYSQSACGFASIATGTTPANHGIIGNSWYNKLLREKTNCVADNASMGVGCKINKNYQVSGKQIVASTYADELYISSAGKSKVYSIALEPHAAILMAGHKATGVYWLDELSGNWVTSSYYAPQLPEWLISFNSKRFADLYTDRIWSTLLPINYYSESLNDSCNFEIGIKNQTTFPYSITNLKDPYKPYKILKTIPFGNTYTKDLAIELIDREKLGKDDITDYLNISFTATQEIGDKFGNLSKEVEDTYVRMDFELMFFINYLESTIGKDNFLLILTSNHGVATSPKYELEKNMPSGIFKQVEAMYILDKHLDATYGDADWIDHYYAQQVYFNQAVIATKHIPLEDIQKSATDFLMQLSGIQQIMNSTVMEKTDFTNNDMQQKIDNSYNQSRSGDLFIQFKPGWGEQSTDVVASHISGYSYDTHVPLIWYGWKMQPKTLSQLLHLEDIIVSLCSITNTPRPNMATGKIIEGLIE